MGNDPQAYAEDGLQLINGQLMEPQEQPVVTSQTVEVTVPRLQSTSATVENIHPRLAQSVEHNDPSPVDQDSRTDVKSSLCALMWSIEDVTSMKMNGEQRRFWCNLIQCHLQKKKTDSRHFFSSNVEV